MRLKKSLLIAVLSLLAFNAWSDNFEVSDACRIGQQFLSVERDGRLVYNDGSCYVFNYDPGFVIVSADPKIGGVLGFSEDGTFDVASMPDGLKWLMNGYGEQIRAARADSLYAARQMIAPRSVNAGNVVVGPLVPVKWSQGGYYNSKCPEDDKGVGGHVQVGCGAIVMGSIMRYWQFPTSGQGSVTYDCNFSSFGYGDYGTLSADFENTIYDYANMPVQLTSRSTEAEVSAVATLLYHCGVSVYMAYGPKASTSNSMMIVYALSQYFKYPKTIQYIEKNSYKGDWWNLVTSELDAGAPFMYGGQGPNGGHVFICDGYRDDRYVHIVWGWGGQHDAYFKTDDLTPGQYSFNSNQAVIVGIRGPQLPVMCSSVAEDNVTIWPTITDGEVNIEGGEGNVVVVNASGMLVLRTAERRLDLSSMPCGVYFVRVGNGIVRSVVKK